MEFYDVILIGAGPAGLLLGKELSRKHSVLVLEKNKVGDTNKNWLTYEDRWNKEKFPLSLIENKFTNWHIQLDYKDKKNEIVIKDKFVCFDEHKFLTYLSKLVKRNKGTVLENTPFMKFRRKNGELIINNKYKTLLLVDCSGIDLAMVKKYKLIEFPIYINCYAYIGEFKRVRNYNFYQFFKNNQNNYSVFGFTKIAPKLAQLQFFEYSNKKLHLSNYKLAMQKAQNKFKIPNHKIKEWKIATYPTGILKKSCLDNIFLFGDAGFYSPSYNGMGFNEILRQYHKVAKHLSNCIKTKKFSEADLKLPKDIADDINNLIFRLLGIIINDIPLHIYNDIFNIINSLSEEDTRRIMRNTVADKEVINFIRQVIVKTEIGELIRHLKKHHFIHIIKTLKELGEDIFSEEIHDIVFKHHKLKIKDMYY